MVEAKNPTHAAAYRVVYERFNPSNCYTRERQNELKSDSEKILEWAKRQTPDIQNAYEWAVSHILNEVERKITINEFNNRANQAFQELPKLPGS